MCHFPKTRIFLLFPLEQSEPPSQQEGDVNRDSHFYIIDCKEMVTASVLQK